MLYFYLYGCLNPGLLKTPPLTLEIAYTNERELVKNIVKLEPVTVTIVLEEFMTGSEKLNVLFNILFLSKELKAEWTKIGWNWGRIDPKHFSSCNFSLIRFTSFHFVSLAKQRHFAPFHYVSLRFTHAVKLKELQFTVSLLKQRHFAPFHS